MIFFSGVGPLHKTASCVRIWSMLVGAPLLYPIDYGERQFSPVQAPLSCIGMLKQRKDVGRKVCKSAVV